jgi:Kef-type K+ transport system membrane component KefB
MVARMQDPGSGRQETETARLDRNLSELLQELRVALPGVQVLFAFLLTIPFNQRFELLTTAQERIYLGTLLSTTIAAVLLISPTAYHRLTFHKQQKARLVLLANRLAIVGLGFLALAMTGVVLLVTDFLFDTVVTVACTTFAALMFATFWYALPLLRRARLKDDERRFSLDDD